MCSVFGFISIGKSSDKKGLKEIYRKFFDLAYKAENRGRDSWGFYLIRQSGQTSYYKGIGRLSQANEIGNPDFSDLSMIIANTRAEPTTEFVNIKSLSDIQPFASDRFVVAHNGTIANDKDLRKLHSIIPISSIDSAILPPLFEKVDIDLAIPQLKGSFTLAICDLDKPQELHLIRNIKPIAYLYDTSVNGIWYASEAEWLQSKDLLFKPDIYHPIIPEPYSHIIIDGFKGQVTVKSIDDKQKIEKLKVLVIASGGLDSTVVATLLRNQGHEVHLFHVSYGCHATKREEQAIKQISQFLGVELTIMANEWLGSIGGSSLTVENSYIAEGIQGAEYPHEWVPARNMLLIASACAYADVKGFDAIAMGTNLEEGGAYSDNTEEFIKIMDMASRLGTSSRARIISPIGNLMKHEIVKLGIEINAPLHLTWSCYKDKPLHCGNCGPCFMRKQAFLINNIDDPIKYC